MLLLLLVLVFLLVLLLLWIACCLARVLVVFRGRGMRESGVEVRDGCSVSQYAWYGLRGVWGGDGDGDGAFSACVLEVVIWV
jgi:hypothetical protein